MISPAIANAQKLKTGARPSSTLSATPRRCFPVNREYVLSKYFLSKYVLETYLEQYSTRRIQAYAHPCQAGAVSDRRPYDRIGAAIESAGNTRSCREQRSGPQPGSPQRRPPAQGGALVRTTRRADAARQLCAGAGAPIRPFVERPDRRGRLFDHSVVVPRPRRCARTQAQYHGRKPDGTSPTAPRWKCGCRMCTAATTRSRAT
jgi:hypothetical protein